MLKNCISYLENNDENKPLNELTLIDKINGVSKVFPALSLHWVEPRPFLEFHPLSVSNDVEENQANLEKWLQRTKIFNYDLEFLLKLEHHKFWSYFIYQKSCIQCVISFLQEATPFYITIPSLKENNEVNNLYNNVLTNVLRIICRLITNKETKTEWMTKESLKEILHSKCLISVPMIFDLIITYGRTNSVLLTRIINTIFQIEPKYKKDLKIGLGFLQKQFIITQNEVENSYKYDDISFLKDISLYVLDCASCLSILLELYPKCRSICAEMKMDQSISKMYDNLIPMLYKTIYTVNPTCISFEYINLARIELLKAFHSIVTIDIDNILKNPANEKSAENFIAVLTECLSERTFVHDYQKYFPVENDMEVLKQVCKKLDLFKADYVTKAYISEALPDPSEITKVNLTQTHTNKSGAKPKKEENLIKVIDMEPVKCTDDEIQKVQDVLPFLGDGFIRKVLSKFNNNGERAIASILEGNLPADLAELDQTEVYIPPDPQDIFDNPHYVLKKGKGYPNQPKNIKELIDDKTFVHDMKERFQEYGYVTEPEDYNDEYDDSYDSFLESEVKIPKLQKPETVENKDNIEEIKENKLEENIRDTTKDFCENPEVARARYESLRNAKYSNRIKKNHQKTQPVEKSKTKNTEKDTNDTHHNKKDNYNSARGKHNRKIGAAWKRR